MRLFFATEDDRWIFLHRRAAHHAARQERVLGCGHSDAEVAEAVRHWKGADLEEAVVAAGACAALVRTHDEWARLEQAAAVAGLPLLEVTKIGDSDPEPAGGPRARGYGGASPRRTTACRLAGCASLTSRTCSPGRPARARWPSTGPTCCGSG